MLRQLPFNQFNFRVVRELGAGGLGRVDEIEVVQSNALDKPVGSRWARKRLNGQWAANPIMQKRFEREISALDSMHHPSIVNLEGQNLPGGERFYVMPVFNSSLRKFIASGTHLGDWRFVANRGLGLANALSYAHGLGFIHRDLKPDNVLFNAGQALTITDWGLGYFIHEHSKVLVQLTRGRMGTEYYCSMEQWATGKCDVRGDIYSLGMTLDEMLTGMQRVITPGQGLGHVPAPTTGAGPRALHALFVRMTSLFPAGRPDTMAQVAAELRAIANL